MQSALPELTDRISAMSLDSTVGWNSINVEATSLAEQVAADIASDISDETRTPKKR